MKPRLQKSQHTCTMQVSCSVEDVCLVQERKTFVVYVLVLDSHMLCVTICHVCPHRLVWSRTQAFQAWYMGSNPVEGTKTSTMCSCGGFLLLWLRFALQKRAAMTCGAPCPRTRRYGSGLPSRFALTFGGQPPDPIPIQFDAQPWSGGHGHHPILVNDEWFGHDGVNHV
jgi:hypothetical protein